MQITAFFVESRELAFPLFVISFFFGGMGMVLQVSCLSIYLYLYLYPRNFYRSFQDACANGFIATLSKDSEYKMSIIHAAYGMY